MWTQKSMKHGGKARWKTAQSAQLSIKNDLLTRNYNEKRRLTPRNYRWKKDVLPRNYQWKNGVLTRNYNEKRNVLQKQRNIAQKHDTNMTRNRRNAA